MDFWKFYILYFLLWVLKFCILLFESGGSQDPACHRSRKRQRAQIVCFEQISLLSDYLEERIVQYALNIRYIRDRYSDWGLQSVSFPLIVRIRRSGQERVRQTDIGEWDASQRRRWTFLRQRYANLFAYTNLPCFFTAFLLFLSRNGKKRCRSCSFVVHFPFISCSNAVQKVPSLQYSSGMMALQVCEVRLIIYKKPAIRQWFEFYRTVISLPVFIQQALPSHNCQNGSRNGSLELWYRIWDVVGKIKIGD